MLAWRVFERTRSGAWERWQIRREGIRCYTWWRPADDAGGESSRYVLEGEEHAQRYVEQKIREKLRAGYIEVAGEPVPAGNPDALVVDTIADAEHKPAHGLERPEYRPVDGFPGVVCHAMVYPRSPQWGFYYYLVLRDEGRSALKFNVKASSHDPEAVAAFLETAVTVRDLPFDGRSHHKLPLTRPAGRFGHILLCSPALGQMAEAYPDIARRVAAAFPIYDCEIGDRDLESFVEARISGRGAIPWADWNREPHPAVDLRFDIKPGQGNRLSTFKMFELKHMHEYLDDLAAATPDSWLEVRSFRQNIRRVTPADITPATADDLVQFLMTG
jgi:hypothetical protein